MDIDYLDLCMVSYVTADQELDAHTQAASQIFGVPMAEVTPAQRRLAKERNFGTCYGRPPWHPNKSFTHPCRGSLFLTQAEAASVTQHYFKHHPHMREWFAKHPPGQPIQ